MKRVLDLCLAAMLVAGLVPARAAAELPPLVPREVLFGNPERLSPQISPDGKRLAYLAPDKANVMQVWMKTLGKDDDRVMTHDKHRGIRRFLWAESSRELLYLQDADGDENWHIYGVDTGAGNVRDYTPWQGVRAELLSTNPKFPDTVLVGLNLRDRRRVDVYRIDLRTGAAVLDTENPGDVTAWVDDAEMVVRGAQVITPDGGAEIRWREAANAPWKSLLRVGPEDGIRLLGFSQEGRSVYVSTSVGSDTARVVEKTLATGAEKELAKSPEVDAGSVLVHPTRYVVQAVEFDKGRSEWTVLDPTIKEDFAALRKLSDGDFDIVNRDTADTTWLVAFNRDRGAVRYYSYHRPTRKGMFLFAHQPKLEGLQLAEMKPVVVPASDGLKLPGYLTLPVGVPARKLPLVLLVHGGPWGRDTWGFHPTVQWLANRGYAVLQVNFRASTGYGKTFLHAGDRQWGRRMHKDLIDSVEWAVRQGIADPKRVAIMGGSYGGYSALAGAAFTPTVFRCAVDIVGPSNINTLLRAIPPYWTPLLAMFKRRVGDIDDPKEAEALKAVSPLFSADKIRIPLLIGQGANDPRVPQSESEQIVAAIEKQGGQVTYVLYTDEGHGFARPANRLDFNARAEKFLGDSLGGRVEPLEGERYPGSTAVVREIGRRSATR
jgi:dipeptidyl aminopeptidase/acylaminoacyl peptidase